MKKLSILKTPEYKFKEGFSIKPRLKPDDVFFAMGETHIQEIQVFDLYCDGKFVETYDTFDEAKTVGIDISS